MVYCLSIGNAVSLLCISYTVYSFNVVANTSMDLNLGLGLRAIGLSCGIERSVRFMSFTILNSKFTYFKSPKFKSP